MTSILLLTESNLLQHFQMQLFEVPKTFSQFFFFFFLDFRNLESIFNVFKKKMTLIADVFSNLGTIKYVVRKISKKSTFRRPFEK